ncbi:uncharacterized protein [Cicer arietinum]|uniref:Uncharacterized protein LOC101513894 n=1 Tax=Cicer arietinum TaxID=3827 RepID=A0A1S2Z3D9_CICAR|nr:uncharacterized protein LOC101513894 [Cicer arietinum]
MDVEEAESAVLASSVTLNSTVSRQNEFFSPEDLAWVDSCLNQDSDISGSDWIPLRDALLEIITSQSQSFSTDGQENNESLPYSEEKKITLELNQESSNSDAEHLPNHSSAYNINHISMAVETSTDEIQDNELTATLPSSSFQGNPFLPTYNEEDLEKNEIFDLGLNLNAATYEIDDAAENIFKIWDLDIPSEEGELVKQLEKALSEKSLPPAPSAFDYSVNGKDPKEESVDDLIAGIADLSLNKLV